MKKSPIITLNDFGGNQKAMIDYQLKNGYKISSTATFKTTTGSYTTIVLVRKNWLERLLNL